MDGVWIHREKGVSESVNFVVLLLSLVKFLVNCAQC